MEEQGYRAGGEFHLQLYNCRYLLGLTPCPSHFVSWDDEKTGRNSMPKWIVHVDWQGKCEQRGASPGNNDFGDSPPRPPADVSTLGRGRYGGDQDGHLPGKLERGSGRTGSGRVAWSWGLSGPAPQRFAAGREMRGGRGRRGREGGRGGERKKG